MQLYLILSVVTFVAIALIVRALLGGRLGILWGAVLLLLTVVLLGGALLRRGYSQGHFGISLWILIGAFFAGVILTIFWPARKFDAQTRAAALVVKDYNKATEPATLEEEYLLPILHQLENDELDEEEERQLVGDVVSLFSITEDAARIHLGAALRKRALVRHGYRAVAEREA